jgi:hypothetical protein
MVDIHLHYDRYEKENLESQESLYSVVSKGPKLEKDKYEIAVELGEKVEKTASFLAAIEDTLGKLTDDEYVARQQKIIGSLLEGYL